MKTFKNTFVTIMMMAVTLTITSCGKGTPNAGDEESISLLKQLTVQQCGSKAILAESMRMDSLTLLTSVESVEREAKKNPMYKKLIEKAKGFMDPNNVEVSNIRVLEVDDKIGKSINQANVKIGMLEYTVQYSLQYNTEGELYIEGVFQ